MVYLITGRKGRGKTKYLLDKANEDIKEVGGNIVYLDKNKKQMYELNNKIRLIDINDYNCKTYQSFYGFLCGVISQDHDLQQVYLDSFLTIGNLSDEEANSALRDMEELSNRFKVDFVISVSLDKEELEEDLKSKVMVSL